MFARSFDRQLIDFPVFVLLYLIERHVLRWRAEWTGRALGKLDNYLSRISLARPLSCYMCIHVWKGD